MTTFFMRSDANVIAYTYTRHPMLTHGAMVTTVYKRDPNGKGWYRIRENVYAFESHAQARHDFFGTQELLSGKEIPHPDEAQVRRCVELALQAFDRKYFLP